MDMLWRLMTAIFMIAVGVGLIAIGWLLTGGMLNNAVIVIMAYVPMFLILIGITKGLLVIIEHNQQHKDEE